MLDTKNKLVDGYNGLGNSYYCLKQYDKAIYYYNKILSLFPESKLKKSNINVNNNLGNCYLDLKQFPKSIDYYKKSLLFEDNDDSTYNLGFAFLSTKNIIEGLKHYENRIQIKCNRVNNAHLPWSTISNFR